MVKRLFALFRRLRGGCLMRGCEWRPAGEIEGRWIPFLGAHVPFDGLRFECCDRCQTVRISSKPPAPLSRLEVEREWRRHLRAIGLDDSAF